MLRYDHKELISMLNFLQIKQGSMMLAKIFLRRVTTEIESVQYLERESTQEGLLLQGIHFAYKVHQVCDLESVAN